MTLFNLSNTKKTAIVTNIKLVAHDGSKWPMNNKQKMISVLSILAITLLSASIVSANEEGGIYKWVDERGVTNYSETPPDAKGANAKAQSININRYVPRGSENAVKQLEQQRTEKAKAEKSAKENKEGVKKTGKSADVNKSPADYKEKCANLKQNLEFLGTGNASVKEGDGELRKLNSEEITKRTDETKREIKAFCE
jgi:hypothetical protein